MRGYVLVDPLHRVSVGRVVRLFIPWRDLQLKHHADAEPRVKPLLHDLLVDLNLQMLASLDDVTVAGLAQGSVPV